MESPMKIRILYTGLGLALVAGTPGANAQTVVSRQIADQPVETVITQQPSGTVVTQRPLVTVPQSLVETQPIQTIQTIETVRTIRPAARSSVRRVVTTRKIVSRIPVQQVPVQTIIAANPQPLYDEVPPPAISMPAYPQPAYPPPLYDTVAQVPVAPRLAPAPVSDETFAGSPATFDTAIPLYRYVYEPGRILVIDPNTNIAVQAIPR
jgi:hypothetical protein